MEGYLIEVKLVYSRTERVRRWEQAMTSTQYRGNVGPASSQNRITIKILNADTHSRLQYHWYTIGNEIIEFKRQHLQMYNLKLNIMSNVHPLEVVGHGSETQLQVGENLN